MHAVSALHLCPSMSIYLGQDRLCTSGFAAPGTVAGAEEVLHIPSLQARTNAGMSTGHALTAV